MNDRIADSARPRVLVTAGPTAEDIDPVRFITNRSTGRMGLELSAAVLRSGGQPRLILGPTGLPSGDAPDLVRVRSAEDMFRAVRDSLSWADALVMAAAVADYTPAEPLNVKLKKTDGDLVLRLKRTRDILSGIKDLPERRGKFIVGFSLDVDMNLEEGRRKIAAKNLDLIIVNTTSSFGSDAESACLVTRDSVHECGTIGKRELADLIVSYILDFYKMAIKPPIAIL